MNRGPVALLSTVASDAHTWNLIYLQLFMEERGFEVVNLGPCVPHEETAAAVESLRPDIVVISSVNGHGLAQSKVLMEVLQQTVSHMPRIVVGGKLATSDADHDLAREQLLSARYDAVFQGPSSIEDFHRWLSHTLRLQPRERAELRRDESLPH